MRSAAPPTRLGSVPRFSRATMYAPPLVSYARTVCMYETMTTARRIEIAIEIGKTRYADVAETASSTMSADSVA